MESGRHIPVRKCIGCNERKAKKDLLRIVKTPEGDVVLDAGGKARGRGAYLCRDSACLARARKCRSAERSLGMKIPEEVYDRLEEEMVRIEND